MKTEDIITKAVNKKVSRRTFIKTAAIAGGAAAATGAINLATATTFTENTPVGTAGVQYKRTTCFGCNGSCGVQVKIVDGVAVKIDGNPWDRQVSDVTYASANAATSDVTNVETQIGRICAKGQAGIKSAYTPQRILQPLRRSGARGSGQWTAITWTQALNEIVAGGGPLGTPALHDLVKTDAIAQTDIHEDFRDDFADAGDRLATFGPKSRQIVYTDGRNHLHGHGRFWGNLLGTARVDHSSVCNGSWKTAGKLTYGEYVTKSDVERTNYLLVFGTNVLGEANVPNTWQSRKIAAKLRDPNFTLVTVDVRRTTTASKSDRYHAVKSGGDGALALGMIKHIIEGGLLAGPSPVDKNINGDNWTNNVGTYLRCANQYVATANGFLNHSDAAWLIDTVSGKYTTASDAGVAIANTTLAVGLTKDSAYTTISVADASALPAKGTVTITNGANKSQNFTYSSISGNDLTISSTIAAENFAIGNTVALQNQKVVLVSGVLTNAATLLNVGDVADLDASDGDNKTVFKALKDLAAGTSWGDIETASGLTQAAIQTEAAAFWNASNPSIIQYRGASQTSNGTYNAILIHALTTLRNRWDVAGGQLFINWGYGTASAGAGGSNSPATGVNWDRANKKYSEIGSGPATATLSWHKSAAAGAQQEAIKGMAAGYPFKASAYVMYAHNPVYTHPGAFDAYSAAFADTNKLPLFVSIDLFVNETNQFADYILPDTSWLERWGYGRNPNYGGPLGQNSKIRRPVIGQNKAITIGGHSTYINVGPNSSVTGDTFADYADFLSNVSGPLDVEDIFIAFGNVMKAQPGATAGTNAYGANGMGEGLNLYTTYDLHNQLWRTSAQSNSSANSLAADVAAADALASTVNGADSSVTGLSNGAKAIFMGLRANTDVWVTSGTGANIYSTRRTANARKIMPDDYAEVNNGRGYAPKQVPKLDDAVLLSNGTAPGDSSVTYPFTLSQWKEAWHTQARSSNNEWLVELRPENTLDMNPADAATVGVETGDTVKLTSASNSTGVTAKVRVTSTVRAGVVAASHHFGRTQQGAAPVGITGGQGNIAANPDYAKGVTLTPVTRNENGFTITDQYGGATLFYGSRVKVEKA